MTELAPHASSWYAATAHPAPERPPLDGDATCDVCVIGAGFTGLSTALHLAKKGRKVIVIEANRVGWGASGRNGGQLHSGQRRDQETLESWFGETRAHALFALAEEAKRTVKDLILTHAIDCDWRDGLIHAVHKKAWLHAACAEAEHLIARYGYEGATFLDAAGIARAIGTDVYFGGWRDATAGHLHPLNFALGLADAAEEAGARICEGTRATAISSDGGGHRTVTTATGTISASDVVIAANGYLDGLDPEIDARVMPIRNFVLATEPLGARASRLIPFREAVADSRFVVHYWRISADGRMLFGGGETYGTRDPKDVAGFVRRHMLKIYPDLADVKIDHAWGGTLAVTMNRMPFFRRLRPGVYTASGYSGHGVAIATFAGKLLAEAIEGDTSRFDVMASIPARAFPGGRRLRQPTLVLAMTWFALRDRLG
ncbi:MAG: FAD-binding oxidoreductase [Phyllobacteriaceae bacterium]|nr:FAD-binding oxidoreductase [Phyllobacteriaceae bacterium]